MNAPSLGTPARRRSPRSSDGPGLRGDGEREAGGHELLGEPVGQRRGPRRYRREDRLEQPAADQGEQDGDAERGSEAPVAAASIMFWCPGWLLFALFTGWVVGDFFR